MEYQKTRKACVAQEKAKQERPSLMKRQRSKNTDEFSGFKKTFKIGDNRSEKKNEINNKSVISQPSENQDKKTIFELNDEAAVSNSEIQVSMNMLIP